MRLTTKGRYAVTAMLDLALNVNKGPVSLANISQRQGISLSYLEQLFAKLRRQNLVSSVRGPGGGYRLSRNSSEIYIAQIIDSVSEPVDATRCGGKGNCQDGQKCLTHELWSDLSNQIYSFLSDISLESLVKRNEVKLVAKRQLDKEDSHKNSLPINENLVGSSKDQYSSSNPSESANKTTTVNTHLQNGLGRVLTTSTNGEGEGHRRFILEEVR